MWSSSALAHSGYSPYKWRGLMGAVNIVVVGLQEDVAVRFPVAKELGATAVVNGSTEDVVARCQQICGKDNLGLVIECSGANIALKQPSKCSARMGK